MVQLGMRTRLEALPSGPLSIPSYPSLTAQERWNNSLSDRERLLRRLFDHKGMRLFGFLALSAAAGLAARNGQLSQDEVVDALQNFASERFTGLAGVDTGPTAVDNVYFEGASSLLFKGTGLYAAAAFGFDKFSRRADRLSGRAEVPDSWENHRIIIDPYRLVFDAVANVTDLTENPVVLVHGGDIYDSDKKTLIGGQLNYKNQRHINALGIEYMSDAEVLGMARPGKAEEVIINLWNPNRSLYDDDVEQGLSPAKAYNILLTLGNEWPGVPTTVIAPKSTKESSEFARHANVLHPEDVVADYIASLAELEDQSVSVVSSIKNVQKGLIKDLRSRRLKIREVANGATIAFVYEGTDDETIMGADRLLTNHPELRVVPMIEREANIGEAAMLDPERTSVIFIPHIVAQKVVV